MRIMHILASHMRIEGGMPIAICNLMDAQIENGDESVLLSLSAKVSEIENDNIIFANNIHIFLKSLRDFNPDIIIFHGVYYWQYFIAGFLVQKKHMSYCIEPHGAFVTRAQEKSRIKKYIANRLYLNRMLKNACAVVFLNETEKSNSIFNGRHSIVIPNGCDVPNIVYDRQETVSFFYIGRLDVHHKGLDVLLDAADVINSEDKRFCLNIYGTGDSKTEEYLKERIEHNNSIKWHGRVSGDGKARAFQENSIMILTSRYEGMPITVLEALANGCPCVVTRGTNMADEIQNNNLGWVCNLDFNDVANTIRTARADYIAHKTDYISNTRDYMRLNFSWRHVAEVSHEQYVKAIKENN